MIHFEDIWNLAEEISKEIDSKTAIANIKSLIDGNIDEVLGELIINICVLSREYDINAAAALIESINDIRADKYE